MNKSESRGRDCRHNIYSQNPKGQARHTKSYNRHDYDGHQGIEGIAVEA